MLKNSLLDLDVNLRFTMRKSNWDTLTSDGDTIVGVIDVAQLGTNSVRVIIDGTGDILRVITNVGKANKSVTTSEGVELIVLPALNKLVIPDGLALTCTDGDVEELVELCITIVVAPPERLTVLGIVATVEALLTAVVDDGDASAEEGEHHGIAVLPGIRLDGEETSLIVVIDEGAKNAGILEVLLVVFKTRAEVTHGSARSEHVTHGEEHGVAQDAVEAALIARNISDITVEVLTDGELADGGLKLLPEGLLNLSDGVDTKTIAVVSSDLLDVLDEVLTNEGVALVEIRKTGKTAVLNLGLVVPVLNVAASRAAVAVVVVVRAVEGNEVAVLAVLAWVTHVVAHDIDHEVHATVVHGVVQADEVRHGTEMLVDSSDILGPVAVITLVGVLDDRADPDGIKAHTLDVVEVLLDTLEHTTTVSRKITVRRG